MTETRLISKFGACVRCARLAFACLLGSLMICVTILLLSGSNLLRIVAHLPVLFFAALSAMHAAGWAMKKHTLRIEGGFSGSRGCGCRSSYDR